MTLKNILIYDSPLSDQIMIGRIGKRPGVVLDRREATSEFIGALLRWNPPGTVRTVTDSHGNSFEIEVRAIAQEQP
jgi:hypothetical protein